MACRKQLKQTSIEFFLASPPLKQREIPLGTSQTSLCPQAVAGSLSSSAQLIDSSSSLSDVLPHEEKSLPDIPNDGTIRFPEGAPFVNEWSSALEFSHTDGLETFSGHRPDSPFVCNKGNLIADACVSTAIETSTPIVTYQRHERRKGCMPEIAEELENQSQIQGPLKTSFIEEEFKQPHKSCSLLGIYSYKKCSGNPIGLKNPFYRKRICGQYFLDLGQPDFSYSTCKTCGLFYARGHENDEKLHATFHKSYLQGIQFKGWQKERLVKKYDTNGDRIILVLPTDPPHNQLKVKEVATIMGNELGLVPGWLLHSQCKVVGCMVAESIKEAYPVFPAKGEVKDAVSCTQEGHCPQVDKTLSHLKQDRCCERANKHGSKILMFGNIKFERELHKGPTLKSQENPTNLGQAVICSNTPVHALCGVRGIWVSREDRRRGIATKLLDAMRTTFLYGFVVDSSQCAFSQPTPDGKAFAAKYCKSDGFLVYS